MDLSNISIFKMLPLFMQNDIFNKCLADFISNLIQDSSSKLKALSIWNSIDELSDEDLDLIAVDFNITSYSTTLSITQKREIIKNSFKVKMTAGTKEAIEVAIKKRFNCDNVEFVEWFEPGTGLAVNEFQVKLTNPADYSEFELMKVFNDFGRKSSILDSVLIIRTEEN